MKKVYLKIFLVLYLSLTIFTIVGAISVAAIEPEVDEADYLATAVDPGDDHGNLYQYQFKCKYCGSNGGNGVGNVWLHQYRDDKDCSCICDCLCGNQYYC